MKINVIVDSTWRRRLQLSLILARPMCRHLTSGGISDRPLGVHEFGITFLVGNPNSPCGDCKARMNHKSHITVILVPKDCVCPIINSLS